MGRWTFCFRCKRCDAYLSSREVFYAQVCPYCGHAAAGTILEHRKEVGRWVGHLWWKRWIPKEGDDDDGRDA